MEFVRSGKVKAPAKSAREGLEGSERDELKRAEAKRASLKCLAGADVAQGSRMERRVLSAPCARFFLLRGTRKLGLQRIDPRSNVEEILGRIARPPTMRMLLIYTATMVAVTGDIQAAVCHSR